MSTASAAKPDAPPLNWERVATLSTGRSSRARAEAAASVAAAYSRDTLAGREREIALDIIEILARDVEQSVRQALSDHIKHCPFLPPRIARALAADIESVALPMIRYSSVLGEDDLMAIIGEGAPTKLLAVGARSGLTPALSQALVETGNRAAVLRLLENHTARIAEKTYHTVIDRYADDDQVQELMVDRPALPLSVTARLIEVVSGALRQRLMARHDFPAELATELATQARDRALIGVLAVEPNAQAVEEVTGEIREGEGVPAMLLLRALCSGEFRVFELALARLAGTSAGRTRQIVADPAGSTFAWLYRKAGLPDELFHAFRAALEVRSGMRGAAGPDWRPRFVKRVIDRLVHEYGVLSFDDLEHVLSQLSRRVARPAPGHAPARPPVTKAPAAV